MNCKDIESALRIIAQFEERALGRHNSNRDLPSRRVSQPPFCTLPSFTVVTFKQYWKDCEVGEYVREIPGVRLTGDYDCLYHRIPVNPNPNPTYWIMDEEIPSKMVELTIWEFEKAQLLNGHTMSRSVAWKRVK